MSVSICILAKNEEKNLTRCIESFAEAADEIILVDNGSTDRTISIANSFGCRIFKSDLPFDIARNVYLENARCEWTLAVDADEILLAKDLCNLKSFLSTVSPDVAGYYIPIYQYFGSGHYSIFCISRLIRTSSHCWYDRAIHSGVQKKGKFDFFHYPLLHHLDGLMSEEHSYKKRERNIELLMEYLDASKLETNNRLEITCELAREYLAQGAIESAEKLYSSADNGALPFAILGRAFVARLKSDYDRTIELSERFIEAMAKITSGVNLCWRTDIAYVMIANALYRKGDVEGATRICLNRSEYLPYFPHHLINYWWITGGTNDTILRRALDINGFLTNPEIYVPQRRYTLASIQNCLFDDVIISSEVFPQPL